MLRFWVLKKSLWAGLLSATVALLPWTTAAVLAAKPFAGVTAVEILEERPGEPVLRFQSDLPFQYRLIPMDDGHLGVEILNARLAEGLKDPQGVLNLSPTRSIHQGTVESLPSGGERLILVGKALRGVRLRVEGATPLETAVASALHQAGEDFPVAQLAWAAPPVERPRIAPPERFSVNTSVPPALSPNTANTSASGFLKLSPPPATATPPLQGAVQQVGTAGAQAAIMPFSPSGVIQLPPFPGRRVQPFYQPMGEKPPASRPVPTVVYEAKPAPVSSRPVEAVAAAAPAQKLAVSTPPQEGLKALPRYRGGAPPISFVVSSTGETITLPPAPVGPGVVASVKPPVVEEGFAQLALAETSPPPVKPAFSKPVPAKPQAISPVEKAKQYAAQGERALQAARWTEAETAFEHAIRLQPGRYEYRHAVALYRGGKPAPAIRALQMALTHHPGHAQALYMIGTLYQEQGQFAEALPYLKRAMALEPGMAPLQYNLGLAYEMSGRLSEARTHYHQALRLDPTAQDAKAALARISG